MLWLSYFPIIWKLSIIILMHKPGKPFNVAFSYRALSIVLELTKLFKKLVLQKIRPIVKSKTSFLTHSSAFELTTPQSN